ncbi:hypothetical protein LXL04_025242 [Taraxacum kok-saghyz]
MLGKEIKLAEEGNVQEYDVPYSKHKTKAKRDEADLDPRGFKTQKEKRKQSKSVEEPSIRFNEDLLRTHIFPRTRELPQFPISPKPLFLSKNRLRNPPKPVLKQNKKLCTYAQKKSLHICKSFFRKIFFATGLIFERILAPRSRFFEKVNERERERERELKIFVNSNIQRLQISQKPLDSIYFNKTKKDCHSFKTRTCHSQQLPFFFSFLSVRYLPNIPSKNQSLKLEAIVELISYKPGLDMIKENFPSISHDFPPYLLRNQFLISSDSIDYLCTCVFLITSSSIDQLSRAVPSIEQLQRPNFRDLKDLPPSSRDKHSKEINYVLRETKSLAGSFITAGYLRFDLEYEHHRNKLEEDQEQTPPRAYLRPKREKKKKRFTPFLKLTSAVIDNSGVKTSPPCLILLEARK